MPISFAIPLYTFFALVIGTPTAGLGFFLQGFLRLRNAVLLLLALSVLGFICLVFPRPYERVFDLAIAAATIMLMLSPFFGLGWYLGVRDTKRRVERGTLA